MRDYDLLLERLQNLRARIRTQFEIAKMRGSQDTAVAYIGEITLLNDLEALLEELQEKELTQ